MLEACCPPRTAAPCPAALVPLCQRGRGGCPPPEPSLVPLPECPGLEARCVSAAAGGKRTFPGGQCPESCWAPSLGELGASTTPGPCRPPAPAVSRGAEPRARPCCCPPGQPDRPRHWGAPGEGPLAAGSVCAGKGCDEPRSLFQLRKEPFSGAERSWENPQEPEPDGVAGCGPAAGLQGHGDGSAAALPRAAGAGPRAGGPGDPLAAGGFCWPCSQLCLRGTGAFATSGDTCKRVWAHAGGAGLSSARTSPLFLSYRR